MLLTAAVLVAIMLALLGPFSMWLAQAPWVTRAPRSAVALWQAIGLSALASGIGLLSRRAWARVLTLIVAGFAALGGLIFLFFAVAAWFAPNMAMDGPERGILILGSLILLFGGLIFLGYCLWAYLVLPRSVYGQEFR